MLFGQPQVRHELDELFEVLEGRVSDITAKLEMFVDVPLHVHARYARIEMLGACDVGDEVWVAPWQTGIRYVAALPADLLAFTPDGTGGASSPATRHCDYAVSPELSPRESQSATRAGGEAGRPDREDAS